MANNHWVIGVDLGATKTVIALVSPDNTLVTKTRIETRAIEGPNVVADRIAAAVAELRSQASPEARITRVGVCSPGPVNHLKGFIYDPPNLTGWRDVPFAQMLNKRLGLPVQLEHDAKAAALAEFHLGAGRGARNMALLTIGTGIGAAIILDGQLYRGPTNSAGEVGHITVDLNGPICTCGSNGCVETYACGPAIMRWYSYSTRKTVNSAEDVARAAREGDAIARRVFQQAGRALGAAVATVAMMMDVDTFILFGSVVRAGDLLLEPARAAVPNYAFSSVSRRMKILTCELGDDAGVLGAALAAKESDM